jgi:glucose-6-phosphate-specific signal transduction histidine kinase
MTFATARNILIILVIAALVVLLPGGGTGANVALQAIYLVFLATLGWFAMIMYRQHRTSLYSLGDRRRAILYGALVAAAVALTGTSKLWQTGAGSVVWLVVIAGAVYAVAAIVWSARKY